jgi:hypothetical protein
MKYMNSLLTGFSMITMICCMILMFTEPNYIQLATYVFLLAGVLGIASILTAKSN